MGRAGITTGRPSPLLGRTIRTLRKRRRAEKITDTTGDSMTGGMVLARSLALRRLLRRHVLQPDERHVGILLPPTCAAVAVNLALSFDRRVTTNLNYTLTSELLNQAIARAGIRHVLTSRRFMERMSFDLDAELVYLEDLRDKPTPVDKAVGAIQGFVTPPAVLLRMLKLHRVPEDEVLTVVFTSGSTGEPKGAMLTHGNVASNLEAVDAILRTRPSDVVAGILPFFHSFGYTILLWAPMTFDVAASYHVNPLEAKIVGQLCRERKVTILLATPLFLRTYLRRCDPADFASLDVLITGAEKLPARLADEVEAAWGIRPIEGYGTTETSPLIAANVPVSRATGDPALAARAGTVGKSAPGVRVKAVDLDDGGDLPAGERGMLLVRGPNVMGGYLGRPDATAAVMRDGWYVTGDVGTIDADGFVTLMGRESRFAKIGGEMVPLGAVEDVLLDVAGCDDDGNPRALVTAITDPERGERLVVVHTGLEMTPAETRRRLAHEGLPNLYLPGADSFVQVERLPTVGSGKLDLKGLRRIAEEAFAERR